MKKTILALTIVLMNTSPIWARGGGNHSMSSVPHSGPAPVHQAPYHLPNRGIHPTPAHVHSVHTLHAPASVHLPHIHIPTLHPVQQVNQQGGIKIINQLGGSMGFSTGGTIVPGMKVDCYVEGKYSHSEQDFDAVSQWRISERSRQLRKPITVVQGNGIVAVVKYEGN